LLAIIETATGKEWPLHAYDSVFPVAKQYDGIESFDEIMQWQDNDREGFVLRFESGQRVKIKFDEYKRLHKLLTGVSPKAIWDILRTGGDLQKIVDRVPDEFHQWVRETENDLRHHFTLIEERSRGRMKFGGSRKELAE
jgi:RNA ligase